MIETAELVERIWQRDPSVWTGRDEAQWLGWLDEPARMRERAHQLVEYASGVDADDVVLLGMGGSSLAPEVMRRLFGAERFHVLDTTHPTAIRRLEQQLDIGRTLFIAASNTKALTTLLLPGEMGERFKVLLLRKGAASSCALPGRDLRGWL